jgi:hypothetical protein
MTTILDAKIILDGRSLTNDTFLIEKNFTQIIISGGASNNKYSGLSYIPLTCLRFLREFENRNDSTIELEIVSSIEKQCRYYKVKYNKMQSRMNISNADDVDYSNIDNFKDKLYPISDIKMVFDIQ